MANKYKLYYFNGRWAAEPTRLVFAAAGVPYEDIRISDTDWATRKSEFAFGQLPILEVDGVFINQSRVICAYVAKQFGLAGANDLEWAQCHALLDTILDLLQPASFVWEEKDEEKKEAKLQEYRKGKLTQYLGLFEKYFKQHVGTEGYVVGNKLTYADLCIMDLWDRFELVMPKLKFGELFTSAEYPTLVAHRARIAAIPNVKKWLDARPTTVF
jgi:glutathione S-transferase